MSAPFGAAVLTGGRSTRMGTDKALFEVDGRPMALLVADVLRCAGAEPVMAVGGALEELAAHGLAGVADPRQGGGPLGGLVSALEAIRAPLVAVMACDLPKLTVSVVEALVSATGGVDVAMGRTGTRLQPLCAVWRREPSLGVLSAAHASGARSVQKVAELLRLAVVDVPDEALVNVNRPSDLPG